MLDENYPEAREYLGNELGLGPEDNEVLLSMASMFLQLQEPDAAINCALQVIDEDENNVKAYHQLALASICRNEFDSAIEFFDHALEIDSSSRDILYDAAKAHIATGGLERAAEYLETALKIDPNDADLKKLKYFNNYIKMKNYCKNRLEKACNIASSRLSAIAGRIR
jgi:tetratricopeptide (TPR) repeat protein